MDYYYSLNNQPTGPVPLDELHQLHRTGIITLETLVVPVGGTEWKPYSTLNPPTPDLAGSAVPGDVPPAESAASTTPSPTASASTPPPPPPTGASGGLAPTASAAATPQPGYKNLVLISWVLLGVTALLSVIPVVGCITWVMLIPVFITTVVLGVMTLQRGGTTQGILILIASVVVLPLFTLVAPILTTALFGAITGAGDKPKTPLAPIVADASPTPTAAPTTPRGTRSPAAPTKPGSAQIAEDPEQLFARLDITQNGYLSGTEMKGYESYDTDEDDRVSKEEFLASSGRGTQPATEVSPPEVASRGLAGAAAGTPDEDAAKQMVDATMTSFKNAVNSGNFDAFYRTELSNLWKKQVTAEKLRTAFKPFIDRKVDLSPIFSVDPVLDEPPYVDGNGLLTLVGHYPLPEEKVKVTFELSYSREGNWALSGIQVNIKPLDE